MDITKQEDREKKEPKRGILHKKISSIYFTALLVIVAAIILGQYHIVSGTPSPLVKRPYFGFSDIYGSIDECTNVPYIIAMNNHQSLCKALQEAGFLESDEQRNFRIKSEIQIQSEDIQ